MNSNLFWCIAGIVGGAIASTLISLFFHFKETAKNRLTYEIDTSHIMSDKINQIVGLEVKYNSNNINNIYSSLITIDNIGNSVIRKHDIVPSCPISISTSGQFLKTKNQYISSYPANKIANYNLLFEENNGEYNTVRLDFDYIPKKATIRFSLFHTGVISFNGDLIDGNIITPTENRKREIIKFILQIILGSVSGFIIGYIL